MTDSGQNWTPDNFVRENIAIVHIYHENLHFLKHERGEVSKGDVGYPSSSP